MDCSHELPCFNNSTTDIARIDTLFPETPTEPLVSNEVKQQLEIYINVISLTVTSLFGIVTNVINITVYWKQGLKDSITVGFFALSCSDIVLVAMSLFTACCYAAKVILPDSNVDFPSVHYVSSGTVRNMGYSISSVLTAFLSVERCCCVILPFKVKFIFTKSRTATAIAVILMVHIVCYIPFFATQSLKWQPHAFANGTTKYRLRVHFSPERPAVEKFNYIFLSIITPSLSQVIVTVCAGILIGGLKKSSKFRNSAMTGTGNTQESIRRDVTSQEGGTATAEAKLTFRDARLVRTMVFLVVIMSISNIPLLAILYAQILIPELNIGRPYHNMYSLCHSIVYVLSSINASVNVFVYYNNSARFRDICQSVLCSKSAEKSKK